MAMQIPWQYPLPYDISDEPDSALVVPRAEADNSEIMRIIDPQERARRIAMALAAGTSRTDIKQLTDSVLDGLLNRN
jgi:hypothetical protein